MFAAIRPCQEYEEYIGVNTAVFPSYHGYKKSPDYYLDGCFYAGGQAKPANDLTFIVSEQRHGFNFFTADISFDLEYGDHNRNCRWRIFL